MFTQSNRIVNLLVRLLFINNCSLIHTRSGWTQLLLALFLGLLLRFLLHFESLEVLYRAAGFAQELLPSATLIFELSCLRMLTYVGGRLQEGRLRLR